ncbi:MAG: hypothetical protein AB8G18_16410 [Gammaproteobacteria bacterium]
MTIRGCVLLLVTMPVFASYAGTIELKNDDFVSGATATFQAGFVVNEVAAVRLVPPVACPCTVTSVSLLFGGSSQTRQMGLQIWDDSSGGASPGILLFDGDVTLTGSNINFQQIDLLTSPVTVSGPFRVGLRFNHSGTPTVATDQDGTINATANFILANVGGLVWFPSALLGVSGDFIIRANIEGLGTDSDGDGIGDDLDNCIDVSNPSQLDTNEDEIGNACDPDVAEPNDCIVNFLDFSVYSNNFLSTGDLATDNNGDGVTNFVDLAVFTEYFLNPPGPSALGCN